MIINIILQSSEEQATDLAVQSAIVPVVSFATTSIGSYEPGGSIGGVVDDDNHVTVGDGENNYDITIPPGVDEVVVTDPDGNVVITVPLPPGSPANLPLFVYLDNNVLTIVYGGLTIVTYIIPSVVYDSWNVSDIYVGFVDSLGNPTVPPGGVVSDFIPSEGFYYESRKLKESSVGWWSPNVYRATHLVQYDITIGDDDTVTVKRGLLDEDVSAARVVYRGGYDVTIPFDDVVTICNAGYGEYIGVRQ